MHNTNNCSNNLTQMGSLRWWYSNENNYNITNMSKIRKTHKNKQENKHKTGIFTMTVPCPLSNRDSHSEVMQNQKRRNQHLIIAKSSESWWSTVPDHFISQSGFPQYILCAMNNPQKSISGDTITGILDWFYLYKDVSKLANSIYAFTENTLNEYKYKRNIRQEYFAVCGE